MHKYDLPLTLEGYHLTIKILKYLQANTLRRKLLFKIIMFVVQHHELSQCTLIQLAKDLCLQRA